MLDAGCLPRAEQQQSEREERASFWRRVSEQVSAEGVCACVWVCLLARAPSVASLNITGPEPSDTLTVVP